MLANQKKWPSQFMWSAILVNKYGLDTYQGLVDNKIPWTDPRAVETTKIMQDLAKDGMFEPSFNSIDVGPAMVPWSQGKALHWYQGSFNLGRFRGENPKSAASCRWTSSRCRPSTARSRSCRSSPKTRS
jgi:raffinose/stachyose/melibiose transport system substrate-binding protein